MPGSEVQELGRLLRETRERKGATLADAHQATKIRLSFLQALEDEDYSVLPPPFYIRGFIKNYAVYLGLDPRQTVQLFDELMDSHSAVPAVVYGTPSADSGGNIPLNGLSQGEARLVESSNEKLNLAALPAPTPPGTLTNYSSDGGSVHPERALVPLSHRHELAQQQKYVLKPVMLSTTKGPFYMPNFAPTVVVIVIVLAALLLVYRGFTSAQQAQQQVAAATATAGATNPFLPENPSLDITQTPGDLPNGATAQVSPTSSVLKAPPFFTPDASIAALGNGGSAPANGNQPAATPGAQSQSSGVAAVVPTPVPPSPTPIPTPTPPPTPIKVRVEVSATDPQGSWMSITVDGTEKVAKMAQPGESFEFTGNKIAVRAGKPVAVAVYVNDVPKVYTQPGAGIITHTWFADGHDTITQ